MTTAITIIVIVVVLLVLAAGAVYLVRSRGLRSRFGPEYDRAVDQAGGRVAGERELRQRERRHAELTLRPIPAAEQAEYARRWREVQAQFVESPADAVGAADTLVTEVMAARGYPTEDFDQQVSDLSVDHAGTLDRYRTAHELRERNDSGGVETEELRQAVVHYRTLFAELLDTDPVAAGNATDQPVAAGTADGTAVDGTAVDGTATEAGAPNGTAVTNDATPDVAATRSTGGTATATEAATADGTPDATPAADGDRPAGRTARAKRRGTDTAPAPSDQR